MFEMSLLKRRRRMIFFGRRRLFIHFVGRFPRAMRLIECEATGGFMAFPRLTWMGKATGMGMAKITKRKFGALSFNR
jgi:hypothetical protein